MKILLVDDNPDDILLAQRELTRMGHTVVGAVGGAAALECYERDRPDVVITDVFMPGMDGFALTREVLRRAGDDWQPVIFLTGQPDDHLQVQALGVGAEAYVVKPVAAEVLEARLKVIERLILVQRRERARAQELAKYYAAAEEERRIAEHLLRCLVSAEKLDDPAIRHWISAAASFGGDLVAAARTPGRALHVLLADGPGHGLAAAINVLPLIAPFYRMTEKGFGIDAIVREMNVKARHFLPEGRFVAATVVAVDFREGYLRVWNGGNPPPVVVSTDGTVEPASALRHVPLGVLDDREFEATTESRGFATGQQLVVYSDGLIEAEDESGQPFGEARLRAALAAGDADGRFDRTVGAVAAHRGAAPTTDDIAMVLIQDDGVSAVTGAPQVAQAAAETAQRSWCFKLRLGARELRALDVVPVLHGMVGQFGGAGDRSGELFVILSELFNNALDHGLLRLDSRQKLDPEGMERFMRERSARLSTLAEGEIEFHVEQFEHDDGAWLRIVCRDTGPGFDHRAVPLDARSDVPFGRGLALIRALSSSFEFNDVGNAATVILPVISAGDLHKTI